MKKNVPGVALAILFFLTACTKNASDPTGIATAAPDRTVQLPPPCIQHEDAERTRIASMARVTQQPTTPVVLLLDFNGQHVQNSAWDTESTISCPAVPNSLLTAAMRDYIFQNVMEDFSGFFVKITRSEQEYAAAPANRRMRCVITYNMMERFGNVGGTAMISSMSWADNTPCFVFCDVLQYNQKYIAGAVSHELGHTLGLFHQSRYSEACSQEEEYHTGFGYGTLGWAPIMGISYYQSIITWHKGISSNGCDQPQDDMTLLLAAAGTRADDYAPTLNNSTTPLPSTGTKSGILEHAGDNDAFWKKEANNKRIRVISNGNSDIAVEVYNMQGQLLNTIDDINGPNIDAVISGKRYIRVRVTGNQPYVPIGNGFGGYTINVSTP
ncbi:MAG: hypothetical protein H7Y42_20020 [Chitinophagaceae bacterium]|nr:hypothetical protein [Chitinophagaceae bacterium]